MADAFSSLWPFEPTPKGQYKRHQLWDDWAAANLILELHSILISKHLHSTRRPLGCYFSLFVSVVGLNIEFTPTTVQSCCCWTDSRKKGIYARLPQGTHLTPTNGVISAIEQREGKEINLIYWITWLDLILLILNSNRTHTHTSMKWTLGKLGKQPREQQQQSSQLPGMGWGHFCNLIYIFCHRFINKDIISKQLGAYT